MTYKSYFLLCILLGLELFYGCKSSEIKSNKQIIGKSSIQNWINISGWDFSIYNDQQFEISEITEFVSLSDGYTFYIFASSGCQECAKTLPIFFKLLQKSNLTESNIFLYGVDEYWEEPSGMHKIFKLEELPIVFAVKDKTTKILNKSQFTNIKIINSLLRNNI